MDKEINCMNGYGALNIDDVMLLEAALNMAGTKGSLSFLEVGVHDGETAQGIKRFCDDRKIELDYTGIDMVEPSPCPPFNGAKFVLGKSSDVFFKIDQLFDVVFVDASHSLNGVMLDIIHYAPKVKKLGYILFHDTSPHIQGKLSDPDGPPELHCQVLKAMETINWPFNDFALIAETSRVEHSFGGMKLYWRRY